MTCSVRPRGSMFNSMTTQYFDKRVSFDFEITFANSGSLQGREFRLDLHGEDITDADLADYVVRDMRLLMVKEVRILNKRVIAEKHKRSTSAPDFVDRPDMSLVDLSHTIENGMITYKGLPAPLICDYLSREASRQVYAQGTEFQIGKIEMVANTGTYLDSPFHRYADGCDLAGLDLRQLAD